jgi:hypothetical protein
MTADSDGDVHVTQRKLVSLREYGLASGGFAVHDDWAISLEVERVPVPT